MILRTLTQAIACFGLAAIPLVISASETHGIAIRNLKIEKLPVLGMLDLSEDRITLELGKRLVGSRVTGVVMLRNSGGVPVAIDGIRTSCGCTSIMRSHDEPLASGSKEKLVVSVEVQKRGEFGVSLSVLHGEDMSMVILAGEGVPTLSLSRSQAESKDGKLSVEIRVNDKSIDAESMRFKNGVVTKVDDQKLTVEFSGITPQTKRLSVFPSAGDRVLDPLVVSLKRAGQIVAPRRPKLSGKVFSVWVITDPSIPHEIKLLANGETIGASSTTKTHDGSIFVTFTVLDESVPKDVTVSVDGYETRVSPREGA